MFLTNIRQRRETIRRIAVYLIEHQEPYLRQGVRFLRAMTRAEVADGSGATGANADVRQDRPTRKQKSSAREDEVESLFHRGTPLAEGHLT